MSIARWVRPPQDPPSTGTGTAPPATPGKSRRPPGYDVVIIGSGAGGSTLAYGLARAGCRVLVVERGDLLKLRPHANGEPVGEYLARFTKPGSPLSYVGGATKFYGAALYRLRESDFRASERACGTSPAWPLSYSDLEPWYERAEELYRVHGSDDGDPSAPPRANRYPHTPIPHHPVVARMIARLRQSGTPVSPIPLALDFAPGRCVLCSTCDGHVCRLNAKMDAEVAALRPALATGRVHLLTQTDCVRVLTDAKGARATGVVLRRDGVDKTVSCGTVAIAAGVPHSALLLWRSRTERHGHGLGNQGDALGRYLGGHSVGHLFVLTGAHALPSMFSKTFAINAFHDGAPGWPHPLGIVQAAGQMPFWEHAQPLLRPAARYIGTHSLTFFYATEAIATAESGVRFVGQDVGRRLPPVHDRRGFDVLRHTASEVFRRAGYRVLARRRQPFLWHDIGTARLGADPAQSVTDPNCQVHGIDGLYVVDQSVLPSAGTVNTSLTVMALALRAADRIAGAALETTPRARVEAMAS